MKVHNRICKNCKYNKECPELVEFNYCKRQQEVIQNIEQFYRDFHDKQRSVDMKIAVYELLGLVKDGKAPEKIKYNEFELKRTMSNNLLRLYVDEEGMFFPEYYSGLTLNDEVEIIEDTPKEDKKIEKLPYYSIEKIQKAKNKDEWIEERISLLEKRTNDYHNKINKIIDKVNGE